MPRTKISRDDDPTLVNFVNFGEFALRKQKQIAIRLSPRGQKNACLLSRGPCADATEHLIICGQFKFTKFMRSI